MARFAKGKHAYFMCDRTGMKYPLSEARTEWQGYKVHRSVFEAKHPALSPPRRISDATVVRNPRPDRDDDGTVTTQLYEVISMTFGGA